MFTTLPHSLTLLPNIFLLPLLSHSFIHPQKYKHTHLYNWDFHYMFEVWFVLYNIISVKLMIILLLQIYIFFNMNLLRTQMFNFIPRKCTIKQLCLLILYNWMHFISYYGYFVGEIWKVGWCFTRGTQVSCLFRNTRSKF